MKQKFFNFFEKKFKMANSKKLSFSIPPILHILSCKFYRLVIWSVELIDVKGIGVTQSIWLSDINSKQDKNTKNAFLAYIG